MKRAAAHPEGLHGGDADEDHTHVRDRRVSDHFLEVGLAQTNHCTPHQGNHSQCHQPELEVLGCVREKGQRQTEHAVSTHLQHHTGQQHRTARWGLYVCIGQPGVERNRG